MTRYCWLWMSALLLSGPAFGYAQTVKTIPFPKTDGVDALPSTRQFGFSPGGKYLWALVEGSPPHLFVWDQSDHRLICSTPLGRDIGNVAAWTPDESMIAITGNRLVNLHSLPTGEISKHLNFGEEMGPIRKLAFTPDGRSILIEHYVYGKDAGYYVTRVDVKTGEIQMRTMTHRYLQERMPSIDVSPSGKLLATVGQDSQGPAHLKIWDAITGKLLATGGAKSEEAITLRFLYDGKQLVTAHRKANNQGELRVWNLENPQEPRLASIIKRKSGDNGKIVLMDKRIGFFNSEDRTITVFDERGEVVKEFKDGAFWSTGLDAHPDGRSLISAAHNSGGLQMWSWEDPKFMVKSPQVLATMENKSLSYQFGLNSDGSMLVILGTGSGDDAVTFAIDSKSGKEKQTWTYPWSPEDRKQYCGFDAVNGVAFFHGPGGDQQELTCVDILTGRVKQVLSHGDIVKLFGEKESSGRQLTENYFGAVAGAKGQRVLLFSKGGGSWHLLTDKLQTIVSKQDRIEESRFSPDGKRFVTIDPNGTGRLYEAATGQEVVKNETYKLSHTWNIPPVFSADGHVIFLANNGSVRRLSFDTGNEDYPLGAHGPGAQGQGISILAMGLEPKRGLLAVGLTTGNPTWLARTERDKTSLRLWHLATGRFVAELRPDSLVRQIVFAPDGLSLFAWLEDSPDDGQRLVRWDLSGL